MAIIQSIGSLTERYQTTVPASVRQALKLQKHDKIVFKVMDNNQVILERQSPETDDPELGRFLDLLSRDIATGTGHIKPMTATLKDRIDRLVDGIAADLDQPLPAEEPEENGA